MNLFLGQDVFMWFPLRLCDSTDFLGVRIFWLVGEYLEIISSL